MSYKTLPPYAKIGQVKPPRRVSAGGVADAYEGGIDVADSTTCAVDDCERTDITARDWCGMHYARWRTHGDPGQAEPYWELQAGLCKHPDGCPDPAEHLGWCNRHYVRVHKHGDPGPVERLLAAPGTAQWRRCAQGYVRRPKGKGEGYEYQHRVVMEQILGRPLEDFENVHHVNGVRHDNRPENLELWVRPQAPGRRARDLARWVIETYPDEVTALFQDSLFDHNREDAG